MRAVIASEPGDPEVLEVVERPDLAPGPGELLIAVAATSVNRADVLQRRGLYAPVTGVTDVLGLEASGHVAAIGEGVEGWAQGDGVCAILPGGGYAEQVTVAASVALPLPPGLDPVSAAAVPEVFATAHDNVFLRARLSPGETVLIQGGASGVGTATIQLAKRAGCRVLVTAGTQERVDGCLALGADAGVVYRDNDWSQRVLDLTDGRGVDVILDVVGAAYLRANLACLAVEGRMVVIGLMGGAKAELDLRTIVTKRLSLMGSRMRSRTVAEREPLMRSLIAEVWPGFADGSLRPIIDRVLPLEQVAAAHRALEAGEVFGKVVLTL